MKKLSIATLALLTTAGVAFAANGNTNNTPNHDAPKHGKIMRGEHKKSHLPRDFEKLNLTEAQKAKIKSIVEADKPTEKPKRDMENFKQKMEARHAAEQKLMSNKTFDEAAARQMIVERQQERLQMEREHAERELKMLKKRHAIFQVLTPEQQKQYQELRQSGVYTQYYRKK